MGNVIAADFEIKSNIFDVANYFLLKEHMSHKKIQKLCYYAEAWSLTKLDYSIAIENDFEAWVHGPVNPVLYSKFKKFGWRKLKINESDIDSTETYLDHIFNDEQKKLLESVWETYGDLGADQLEALTHTEEPWLSCRDGLGKFEISNRVICKKTMKSYYTSISIDG